MTEGVPFFRIPLYPFCCRQLVFAKFKKQKQIQESTTKGRIKGLKERKPTNGFVKSFFICSQLKTPRTNTIISF
jgi:hypothetical protein